jgi:hypothetical protein|tara:strand:- start:2165 stop:2335 length:171 start_codon:yes stop_codon:yes gene_type:complete
MAKTLEVRGVEALEKISKSLQNIDKYAKQLDISNWSERLEWYLSEFHTIYKDKKSG